MGRWVRRLVQFAVLGSFGYCTYQAHQAGQFSLPDLPDGAYTIAFKNGLRAIVLDAEVTEEIVGDMPKYFRSLSSANPDRRYLGIPWEVQPWFEDAWSWCKAPTEEEKAEVQKLPEDFQKLVANARFEAVCRIDVDGNEILRGLIYSVPNL